MDLTRPTIIEITMWEAHNYVSYSDSDSERDYFDGYCLGVRRTIEWIKKDGSDRVLVRFGNGLDCHRYRNRLALISKQCGYSVKEMREDVRASNGDRWTNLWFVLQKTDDRRPGVSRTCLDGVVILRSRG